MANETATSILFNPMMAWADIGLRALEISVSSTQNIGDSLDRMARAGASEATGAAAAVPDAPTAVATGSAPSPVSALALVNQVQRTTFDLMTQAWVQWMSVLGTVASAAAGQKSPANALGWGLKTVAGGATAATQAQAAGAMSRDDSGNRRESHAETAPRDHAHASAGSQRRRSTARVKPKARTRGA